MKKLLFTLGFLAFAGSMQAAKKPYPYFGEVTQANCKRARGPQTKEVKPFDWPIHRKNFLQECTAKGW